MFLVGLLDYSQWVVWCIPSGSQLLPQWLIQYDKIKCKSLLTLKIPIIYVFLSQIHRFLQTKDFCVRYCLLILSSTPAFLSASLMHWEANMKTTICILACYQNSGSDFSKGRRLLKIMKSAQGGNPSDPWWYGVDSAEG